MDQVLRGQLLRRSFWGLWLDVRGQGRTFVSYLSIQSAHPVVSATERQVQIAMDAARKAADRRRLLGLDKAGVDLV